MYRSTIRYNYLYERYVGKLVMEIRGIKKYATTCLHIDSNYVVRRDNDAVHPQ